MAVLCKDCIHIVGKGEFAMCKKNPDLIDGSPKDYCSVEREFIEHCGPKGKWFEPKEPKVEVGLLDQEHNTYIGLVERLTNLFKEAKI